MPLYIDLFPETCYACTVLTCTGRVKTPKCRVIPNQILCQTLLRFSHETYMLRPMIDIYGESHQWRTRRTLDWNSMSAFNCLKSVTYVTAEIKAQFQPLDKIIYDFIGGITSCMAIFRTVYGLAIELVLYRWGVEECIKLRTDVELNPVTSSEA